MKMFTVFQNHARLFRGHRRVASRTSCICLALVFFCLGFARLAPAVIWYVSPDGSDSEHTGTNSWTNAFQTISNAVSRTVNGDEVIISNGSYGVSSEIDITNGILLHSESGLSNTFVYATSTNRCFYLNNSSSIVFGLTISNGVATATDLGGKGGGIYLQNGIVTNCAIRSCTAVNSGGGVYMANGLLAQCQLQANVASNGAGVLSDRNPGIIQHCIISANTAANNGGGVYLQGGGTVRNCLLTGNRIENSVLAVGGGGGIYAEDNAFAYSNYVQNCTIVSNYANIGGGGLMLNVTSATVFVQNNIIFDNASTNIVNYVSPINSSNVVYSCMNSTNGFTGRGNITNAPLFVNAPGGNYQLLSTSAGINVGSNQAWMSSAIDLAGNPRIVGSFVDMGAYEFLHPYPYLEVTPSTVTNTVMQYHATNSMLVITNIDGTKALYWSAWTDVSWIKFAVTTGVATANGSANLLVTNSALTLAGGVYTGQVWVKATNNIPSFDATTSLVTIVLQVGELQRAPATLTNSAMQGEATSNSFRIWNAGAGEIAYTVTTNQPWLVVSQTEGSLSANATNTIDIIFTNTSDLIAGEHTGIITVHAAGGDDMTVDVTLNVQPMPMISASPILITNTVMEGQNPNVQTVTVWNGSADFPIGYEVTTNSSWLTVLVTNTWLAPLTTNSLAIQYAVANLPAAGNAPSNYTGSITITATNTASGSPIIIPVTVQVNPKPRMALSTTLLVNSVLQGRDAVRQTFDILNASKYYTLSYSISNNSTWFVTQPPSGSVSNQPATIEILYSTRNLSPGISNAVITVVGRGTDGTNWDSAVSTQRITVALTVTPLPTLKTDAQTSYSYNVRKGLTPPATLFNVWNSGIPATLMNFTITPSMSWLHATPSYGTSAGAYNQISITCDTTGMIPGVLYRGTVQVAATHASTGESAYGSPQIFTIDVVLREFKGFDFNGDFSGASDLVIYREASGNWEIRNLLSEFSTNLVFGGRGYQTVPGDYTGTGITELGAYRRSSGGWYAYRLGSSGIYAMEINNWIGDGYVGVPGDYDGDGKVDPCVYLEQTGLWMVLMSASGYQQASGIYGGPGYSAVQSGDYDGDGRADPAIYHRTSGLWTVLMSASGYSILSGVFGGSGFVPVPTDYDGDNLMDPAVYETGAGRWFILLSTTLTENGYGMYTYQFGGTSLSATLMPAPGDYDGSGGADLALYDTNAGKWYIITLGGIPLAWGYPMGGNGYIPITP